MIEKMRMLSTAAEIFNFQFFLKKIDSLNIVLLTNHGEFVMDRSVIFCIASCLSQFVLIYILNILDMLNMLIAKNIVSSENKFMCRFL